MALDPGIEALRREFREEANEHLHILDESLLAIETACRAGEPCPQPVLEEMFRSTHTLKGLSSMFELTCVRDLAHGLESVFDRLRKGDLTLDPEALDVLFGAIDGLRDAVGHIDDGGSSAQAQSALSTLILHFDETSAVAQVRSGSEIHGEYASKRIGQAAEEGLTPVLLRLRWGIELRLGAYSVIDLEAIIGHCEILEVSPVLGDIPALADMPLDTQDVEFEVLALTDQPLGEVADAIGMALSRLTVVGPALGDSPAEASSAPAQSGGSFGVTKRRKDSTGFIRVEIERLDGLVNLVGELVTARTRLAAVEQAATRVLGKHDEVVAVAAAVKEMNGLIGSLQEGVMQLRMVPAQQLFSKFPRVVRDLARSSGKDIEFEVTGGETELDKRLIEQIEDPLIHMIRNACDHGIEPAAERIAAGKPAQGKVSVCASQEGSHIVLEVHDDGYGLNVSRIRERAAAMGAPLPEVLTAEALAQAIMAPGFTTAAEVTDVSGRGVGLDVVRRRILDLGGHVEIESTPGEGTTFRVRAPMTLAIASALLVNVVDHVIAIPLSTVSEVLRLSSGHVRRIKGRSILDLRGETLPVIELKEILNLSGSYAGSSRRYAVVVDSGTHRLALVVNALEGKQEVVLKSIGESLGEVAGLSGATILGDGGVVPILDIDAIASLASAELESIPVTH